MEFFNRQKAPKAFAEISYTKKHHPLNRNKLVMDKQQDFTKLLMVKIFT